MRAKNVTIAIMAVLIVVLAGLLAIQWHKNSMNKAQAKLSTQTTPQLDGVDSNAFQAVFLNSGQVYLDI